MKYVPSRSEHVHTLATVARGENLKGYTVKAIPEWLNQKIEVFHRKLESMPDDGQPHTDACIGQLGIWSCGVLLCDDEGHDNPKCEAQDCEEDASVHYISFGGVGRFYCDEDTRDAINQTTKSMHPSSPYVGD